jgi:hypothetical protein
VVNVGTWTRRSAQQPDEGSASTRRRVAVPDADVAYDDAELRRRQRFHEAAGDDEAPFATHAMTTTTGWPDDGGSTRRRRRRDAERDRRGGVHVDATLRLSDAASVSTSRRRRSGGDDDEGGGARRDLLSSLLGPRLTMPRGAACAAETAAIAPATRRGYGQDLRKAALSGLWDQATEPRAAGTHADDTESLAVER